jgi:23S rRNA 5-hydroxycytidine C2501 synthase
MGYVKNITAHYRRQLDEMLERRPELRASSAGKATFNFTPDPDRNFNRESTDYFVNGRQMDIGAFDTPKHAGLTVGHVTKVAADHFEAELDDADTVLNNGDGLTYLDLQKELVGLQANVVARLPGAANRWRIEPNQPMSELKDIRSKPQLHRNRDMQWDRLLERKSAERLIGVWMTLSDIPGGLRLSVTDERGIAAHADALLELQPARDVGRGAAMLREHLAKVGGTIFSLNDLAITTSQPWFVPASRLNALRREALERLEQARLDQREILPRAEPANPPAVYPDDALTYLANVYNQPAHDFYLKHGVKVIEAAYESHEEQGEVSLMITKHCVRWSMSLCPKQAKGVTGVQGTVRAEPLVLQNGSEKLTLRFDCKPCEMHVVGKIKKQVMTEAMAVPMTFFRTRPGSRVS